MSSVFAFIQIAGAVALLLFGLAKVRDGMTDAFGMRLKLVLGQGTRTGPRAFLSGLVATLGLQSSTATALLSASFVERGLIRGRMAQIVFMTRDRDMARRLVEVKVEIRNLERQSAERHLPRLRAGKADSHETSSLHLDILRDLKRINAHITSVAHPILDEEGLLVESRLRAD